MNIVLKCGGFGNTLRAFWGAVLQNKYARLIRLSKPVGFLLLALPCWFGVALARPGILRTIWFCFLFFCGSFLMRSAGCIVNDIVDRKIDCHVRRTAARPITSGELDVFHSLLFCSVLLGCSLVVLCALNLLAACLSIMFAFLMVFYPFMKRLISIPQLFLGFVYSAGALVGYSAVTGDVSHAAIMLFIGCMVWVVAYDTVYSLQDVEYDLKIGIYSAAVYFGKRTMNFVYLLYDGLSVWLVCMGFASGAGIVYYSMIGLLCCYAVYMLKDLEADDPASCLQFFNLNVLFGLWVFIALYIR